MSKPYLVISLYHGMIGAIKERDGFHAACEVGARLAVNHPSKVADDVPVAFVHSALADDNVWVSDNGDLHIVIAQADND